MKDQAKQVEMEEPGTDHGDGDWPGALTKYSEEARKKRDEYTKAWREALGEPPQVEIQVDIGYSEPATIGFWHLEGGVIMVEKKPTGYYPDDKREFLDDILDALDTTRRCPVLTGDSVDG